MLMETLIRGGTIVTGEETYKGDVAIGKGVIEQVGTDLAAAPGVQVIDATGRYVMPGAIDVHVHFELPFCGTVSKDDFVNGTKAGACGGVTCIVDFAIQQKGKSLLAEIENRRKLADGRVCTDYSLHGGITDWEVAKGEMEQAIAGGVTSFKMFTVYKSQGWQADDATLIQALEATANNGAWITVHCENDDVIQLKLKQYASQVPGIGAWGHALTRPDYTEAEAVSRVVRWAEVTRGRAYVVHMSTGLANDEVRRGQDRGVHIHAETCPQYLLLDEELFKGENGHLYGTCPQLRAKWNQERLWKGIQEGSVQVIGTDTCTFDTKQKAMWGGDFRKIPFGMPGVETMLPLMYTYGVGAGRISLNRMVQLIASHPARIFGLAGRKGSIRAGLDADIVVFDPNREVTVDWKNMQTASDWSPFQGFKLKGYPEWTISRGRVVAKGGKFVGDVGWGRFVPRTPWGDIV
jgi:dihydropyrimidinase